MKTQMDQFHILGTKKYIHNLNHLLFDFIINIYIWVADITDLVLMHIFIDFGVLYYKFGCVTQWNIIQ